MTLAVSSAIAFAGVVAYASSREPTLAPVVSVIGALGAVLLLVALLLVLGYNMILGRLTGERRIA